MAAVFKEILRYTEGDYEAFLDLRPKFTVAQLVAHFTRPAYDQMEERFGMEHCDDCDTPVSEEEANDADEEGRAPLCETHKHSPVFVIGSGNDPDGRDDWIE